MKKLINFLQFVDTTSSEYESILNNEINSLDQTLDQDTSPLLYTFIPNDDKVFVTVSDDKKLELGLRDNILKQERLSSYPLGFGHQNLTEYIELIIGKNSELEIFDDAVNYAAALGANGTENKITIVRLIDRKFNNKTYLIIPSNFSNSDYLEIPNVLIGDAEAGQELLDYLGSSLDTNSDGIMI